MIINSTQELEAMEDQIFQLLHDAVHVHIVFTEHIQQCSGEEHIKIKVFNGENHCVKVIAIAQTMLQEFLVLDDLLQEHYEEGLYFTCPVCGLETE